ncbi:MAG: hypothetical protein JNL21_11690 [Myxococcales bacterium]|nr:hypothetical protein [Myxococcales bacterium]
MLPGPLRRLLLALEIVAFAILLRSVAFDRWITVLVSALLLASAFAAGRGKAWGVVGALMMSTFFPVAFVLGMAPAWFVVVGALGALPFAMTWRAFARADRGATAWLAGIGATAGSALAFLWKTMAWPLFLTFPALFPSARPGHGLLVSALLVAGAAAAAVRWKGARRVASPASAATFTRVRIAPPPLASQEASTDAGTEAEWDAHEALQRRRATGAAPVVAKR